MEVKKVHVEDGRLSSEIDLGDLLKRVPKSERERVKADVSEFLIERILLDVAGQKSPVSGRRFKGLSKEYAEHKKEETGSTDANLDLTGAMLGALDVRITDKGIEIGVFGENAGKADGHNNFSGDSNLPRRQFLPDVGEGFRSEIASGVDKIIQDAISSSAEPSKEDFEDLDSKAELYAVLEGIYGDLTRSEIRAAVLRSEALLEILEETDSLKWL